MGLNIVRKSPVVAAVPAAKLPFGGKRHTLTQADRIKGARKAAETRAAKKAAEKLQRQAERIEQRNSGTATEAPKQQWSFKSQIHERFNFLTSEPSEQMYALGDVACNVDSAAARLALDLPGLRFITGIDGFQWCVVLVHRETRSKVVLLGGGNGLLIASEHEGDVPTTLQSDLDLIRGRVSAKIA